jgi:hypothetical protein
MTRLDFVKQEADCRQCRRSTWARCTLCRQPVCLLCRLAHDLRCPFSDALFERCVEPVEKTLPD